MEQNRQSNRTPASTESPFAFALLKSRHGRVTAAWIMRQTFSSVICLAHGPVNKLSKPCFHEKSGGNNERSSNADRPSRPVSRVVHSERCRRHLACAKR